MSLVRYKGGGNISIPSYNTLESLVLIDGDIISTTRSVLDCCNGYYGYMKPVDSW